MFRQILAAAALSMALTACATAPQENAKANLRLYAAGITDQMISTGQCVVRAKFRGVAPDKITTVVVDEAIRLYALHRQKHGKTVEATRLFHIAVEYVMEQHVCVTRGGRT